MNVPEISLLYEEGPCLVVFKPPGLLTQAPPGIDSLETRVKRFLQQREAKEHNLYLVPIHRLDRPVSGAVLLARNVRVAKRLSEQFEQRTVEKKYWTIVSGDVVPDCGTWTDCMRKLPTEPRSEIVDADHPDAQQAILHYRVLARQNGQTFLEIELETGRTHQIRLQAASRGTPVLGDEQYGSTIAFGPATDDVRQRWIALHARRLAFEHPMTHERITIDAPLLPPWEAAGFAPHNLHNRPDANS